MRVGLENLFVTPLQKMEESMIRKMAFDEVVEAVGSLCADDQK